MNTEMDYLVINDFFYSKKDQKNTDVKNKWKITFEAD